MTSNAPKPTFSDEPVDDRRTSESAQDVSSAAPRTPPTKDAAPPGEAEAPPLDPLVPGRGEASAQPAEEPVAQVSLEGSTTASDGSVAALDPAAAEIARLRAELEEKQQQYLRLAADFENFRRRSAQEARERAQRAAEEVVAALLPVLDNLRRAVEHVPAEDTSPLATGVRMTVRQFEEILQRLGVESIPAVGERFDPTWHEAVHGETSSEVEHDTVVAELERGYRLRDRVLRPAKVHVVRPGVAEESAPATADEEHGPTSRNGSESTGSR